MKKPDNNISIHSDTKTSKKDKYIHLISMFTEKFEKKVFKHPIMLIVFSFCTLIALPFAVIDYRISRIESEQTTAQIIGINDKMEKNQTALIKLLPTKNNKTPKKIINAYKVFPGTTITIQLDIDGQILCRRVSNYTNESIFLPASDIYAIKNFLLNIEWDYSPYASNEQKLKGKIIQSTCN